MCPQSHPYAYLSGKRCCKTEREGFHQNLDRECDGTEIISPCCHYKKRKSAFFFCLKGVKQNILIFIRFEIHLKHTTSLTLPKYFVLF